MPFVKSGKMLGMYFYIPMGSLRPINKIYMIETVLIL